MKKHVKKFPKKALAMLLALIMIISMAPISLAQDDARTLSVTNLIEANETITSDTVIPADEVWAVASGAKLTVSGAKLIVEGVIIFKGPDGLETITRHDSSEDKDLEGALILRNAGAYITETTDSESGSITTSYLFGYEKLKNSSNNDIYPVIMLNENAEVKIEADSSGKTYTFFTDADSATADIIYPFVLGATEKLFCDENVAISINSSGMNLGGFSAMTGAKIYNSSVESAKVLNNINGAEVYNKITVDDKTGTNESMYVLYKDADGTVSEEKYTVIVPEKKAFDTLKVDGVSKEVNDEMTSFTIDPIYPSKVVVTFKDKKALISDVTFPENVVVGDTFNAVIKTNETTKNVTINDTVYNFNDEMCKVEDGTIVWTVQLTAPSTAGNAKYTVTTTDSSIEKNVYVVDRISVKVDAKIDGNEYHSGEWTNKSVQFSVEATGGIPDTKIKYKVGGGEEITLTGSTATIAAETSGLYTIYAVDGNNNATSNYTCEVKYDNANPLLSVDLSPESENWESSVTVNINTSDADSGIKSISYTNSGITTNIDNLENGKASFKIDSDTLNSETFVFTAEDNVGNKTEVTKTIKVDKTVPTASVQVKRNDAIPCFIEVVTAGLIKVNSSNYSAVVEAEDTQSGVKSVKCYILKEDDAQITDKEPVAQTENSSVEFDFGNLENGKYVLYTVVTDNAGNTTEGTMPFSTDGSKVVFEVDNSDNDWTVKVNGSDVKDNTKPIYVSDSFSFSAIASNVTKVGSLSVLFENEDTDNSLGFKQYDESTGFYIDGGILLSQFGIQDNSGALCPDGVYTFILVSTDGSTVSYKVVKDSKVPEFNCVVNNPDNITKEKKITIEVNTQKSGIETVEVNKKEATRVDSNIYEFIASSNGTYNVVVTSNSGLSNAKEVVVGNIYTEAPKLSATGLAPNGNNNWFTDSSYIITLSVNEENVGDVVYQLKDSNGEFQTITLNEQSQYIITDDVEDSYVFRAIGENSEKSEEVTVDVKKDSTLPNAESVEFTGGNFIQRIIDRIFGNDVVYLTVNNITDNISGIAKVSLYTEKDGEYTSLNKEASGRNKLSIDSLKFDFDRSIEDNIVVVVEDAAGNKYYKHTQTKITLDKNAPVIEITPSEDPISTDVNSSMNYFGSVPVTVNIRITEDNFDSEKTEVTVNDNKITVTPEGENSNIYTATFTANADGVYNVKAVSTDKANNSNEASYDFTIKTADTEISLGYDKETSNVVDGNLYISSDKTKAIITVKEQYLANAPSVEITKDGASYAVSPQWSVSDENPEEHIAAIDLNGEGTYTITVEAKSKAKSDSKTAQGTVILDKTAPEYKIDYSINPVKAFINESTFGLFFKDTVNVTVTVTDNLAGIKDVKISGATNKEETEMNPIENKWVYSFDIKPQFKGEINVTAVDYTGNSSAAKLKDIANDETGNANKVELVVDGIKPVISDIEGVENGAFVSDDVTASFTIKKENFFKDDVKVTVESTNDLDKKSTVVYYGGKIVKDNKEVADPYGLTFESKGNDEYLFTLSFTDDNDYTITVEYSDKSGNEADSKSTQFTIDKTDPVISVEYDPATPSNTDGSISYYNSSVKATIKVTEHNFDGDNSTFAYTAKDAIGNTVNAETLSESEWIKSRTEANTYVKTVVFNDEANYSITVDAKDFAKNAANTYTNNITVDKTAPTYEIEYNINPVKAFINEITLGLFFKESVVVTVKYEDNLSGIKDLSAECILSDNVSKENKAPDAVTKNLEAGKLTDEISFQIEPHFRGKITVSAKDYAENVSAATTALDITKNVEDLPSSFEDAIIVVDDKKPVISSIEITPEQGAELNGLENVGTEDFANGNVTASFTVTEANFFKDDVKVTVESTDDLGNKSTVVYYGGKIVKDDKEVADPYALTCTAKGNDEYLFTLSFADDNDYVITAEYTDKSGNTADPKSEDFTIDTKNPVIKVNYAPDVPVKNGEKSDYYNNAVTATITITEHNFDSKNSTFDYTANDANGDSVNAEKLSESEWIKSETEANTYVKTVVFNDEANYSITVDSKDFANNTADTYTKNITVDKTAPTYEIEYNIDPVKAFINEITLGLFFKESINVTVTVRDSISGVNNVNIKGILDKDISNVNKTFDEQSINKDEQTAELIYKFTIEPHFRGTLDVVASDHSQNKSAATTVLDITKHVKDLPSDFDDVRIVIDNKKPEISSIEITPEQGVELNVLENVGTEDFANGNVTASFTVTEANFFKDDVKVTVESTDDLGNKSTVVYYGGKIVKDNSETSDPYSLTCTSKGNDEYLFTLSFADDNDYVITAEYTDKSGNTADPKSEDFTIDTVIPVITVTYSPENPAGRGTEENGSIDYYNGDATATIKVTEHNFYDKNSIFAYYATDVNGNTVNAEALSESKWIKSETEDNTYVKTVVFKDDANYSVTVNSKDYALNSANEYKNNLTVDKTLPILEVNDIRFSKIDSETDEKNIPKFADYKHFFNGKIMVTVTAADATSGVKQISFYTIDYTNSLDGEKKVLTPQIYEEKNANVTATFELDTDFKGNIYAQAEDYSTNKSKGEANDGYTKSEGVILESFEKHIANQIVTIKPEREPNANGFYNSDLKVTLSILDDYSGINNLTFKMGADDVISENFEKDDGEKVLRETWSEVHTLYADRNDGRDKVVVWLNYWDNAGNPHEMKKEFQFDYTTKVDATAPVIDISYNNNNVFNSKYFNAARTMTVKITERNFNSSYVTFKITKDGQPYNALIPTAKSWKRSDFVYTTTIIFADDGDYTFDISCIDRADNKNKGVNYGDSAAPKAFTIDNYDPVINVSYDNNSYQNGNYFKSGRTATVTIKEHNFDASKSIVTVTAKTRANGSATNAPGASAWRNVGADTYAATINFSSDAFYSIEVASTDLANRSAAKFNKEEFTVDKTDPEVSITEVTHQSANNRAKITPVVTITDTNVNYADVMIALIGAKNGEVFRMEKGVVQKQKDGYGDIKSSDTSFVYRFDNISVDDIYTLNVVTVDMAGNQNKFIKAVSGDNNTIELNENSMMFSVNRHGSNYILSESTQKVVDKYYVSEAPVLVVEEINFDKIENYEIAVGAAGNVNYISEGRDFTVEKYSPNEKVDGATLAWYKNVYTISKSNFASDLAYEVTLSSTDKATNSNSTIKASPPCEIKFCLDTQTPASKIFAVDVKDGEKSNITINAENATIRINVTDSNCDISKCVIMLDGKLLTIKEVDGVFKVYNGNEEIGRYDAENGFFELTIKNADESWKASNHTIKFTAYDKAGNHMDDAEEYNFTLSTNFWFRFYANKPLFFGSIAGLALIIAGIVLLIVLKRRKDDDEQEQF